MTATRSTLLNRLESELKELDERIRVAQDKASRLQTEKKSLANVIDTLRASISKSAGSVTAMPTRRKTTPATA